MNEMDANRLLECLAQNIPDTPTTTETLLRLGKRRLALRRRVYGVVASAVVVAIVAGAPSLRSALGEQSPDVAGPSRSTGPSSTSTGPPPASQPHVVGTWVGTIGHHQLAMHFQADPERTGAYLWRMSLGCGAEADGEAYIGATSGSFSAVVVHVERRGCPPDISAWWHQLAAAMWVVADGTSLRFYDGQRHPTLFLAPAPRPTPTGPVGSTSNAPSSRERPSLEPTSPLSSTPPSDLASPPPSTGPQESAPASSTPPSPGH